MTARQEPIVVTHAGGLRFAIQVRSHTVIVDQPVGAGGTDTGPMPLELIAASLASCVALYVQRYLESRGLQTEGMRVEADQHGAVNPHRIGEFIVRVVLPEGIPAEHVERVERIARSCPAHATLTHLPQVRISVTTPVASFV